MLALLLAVAVLAFGCATDTKPQHAAVEAGAPVSARTAHGLEQDAIRECMLNAGFDYVGPPYVDRGARSSASGVIKLDDPQAYGYWGVFRSIEFLTPGGEPQGDLDRGHLEAYALALNGFDSAHTFHSHDGDDHTHGDQSHTHEYEDAGCYAIGAAVRAELEIAGGDAQTLTAELQRLTSTDQYERYSQSWRSCLASAGYAVRSTSPLEHAQLASSEYFDLAQQRFAKIFADERDAPAWFREQYQLHDALGLAWFEEALSHDVDLDTLHELEVAEATADNECRLAHWHILEGG